MIISEAEKLNIESQNALLKILEEPRQDILFILELHTLEPLLPTIKSRCWVINFSPLDKEEVKVFLENKFGGKVASKVINSFLNKFNGENLANIIEELFDITLSNDGEFSEEYFEQKQFNFIEFFRHIYLSNFYKALNYLEEFNLTSNRREATEFIREILKFCYLVLRTKISEENRDQNLIKLANVIDEDNFKKVIEFLTITQNLMENYININLILIRLMILIKNSFKKN